MVHLLTVQSHLHETIKFDNKTTCTKETRGIHNCFRGEAIAHATVEDEVSDVKFSLTNP